MLADWRYNNVAKDHIDQRRFGDLPLTILQFGSAILSEIKKMQKNVRTKSNNVTWW